MDRRLLRHALIVALLISACSGATEEASTTSSAEPAPPPTTAATTIPPVASTTTTVPDACPSAFCVIYHIRPEAVWSDGQPVTSADFTFTHEMGADSQAPIVDVKEMDEKTVVVVFSEAYGGWRSLFGVVLPAHATDAGSLLEVTAGPYVLENWLVGESITLRRNQRYWSETDPVSGDPTGDVGEITFVFQESVRSALRALDRDEIDVLSLKPLDWIVADVAGFEGVAYETAPGPFWEHIDFNLDDPLLSQRWVREVIATALPREAIIDETVRTVDPEAPSLDNSLWMTNAEAYQSHYDITSSLETAEQIMVDHFCEKGDDGVYSCQGRRMSFTFAYPLGDPYRETIFRIAEDALDDIGIELIERVMMPSALFSTDFFFGGSQAWQIMSFSWRASEEPSLANEIYLCEGDAPSGFGALNVTRYCSDEADTLIAAANTAVDAGERASIYNSVDAGYLADLASIPLFQKPEFIAWNSELTGPRLNMSSSTTLWNVGSWAGREDIVVSIEEEPTTLDPLAPQSDSAAMILAALFSGAFSSDPALQLRPVLIERAEIVIGGGG
ncbi:MAG: ABC transporter substrate-binding protein [Actinomycetota bacterium]|nr:ABC transporter substrate-binding protein [Actinomycetota bacterium]